MDIVIQETYVGSFYEMRFYLVFAAAVGALVSLVVVGALWRRWGNRRRMRVVWLGAVSVSSLALLGAVGWFGPVVAGNFVPEPGPSDCDALLKSGLVKMVYSVDYGAEFKTGRVNGLIAHIHLKGGPHCGRQFWSPRAYDAVPGTYVCEVEDRIGINTSPVDKPVKPRPTRLALEMPWEEKWPLHRTGAYSRRGLLVYFTNGLVGLENWSPPHDGAKCWVWDITGEFGPEWFAGY